MSSKRDRPAVPKQVLIQIYSHYTGSVLTRTKSTNMFPNSKTLHQGYSLTVKTMRHAHILDFKCAILYTDVTKSGGIDIVRSRTGIFCISNKYKSVFSFYPSSLSFHFPSCVSVPKPVDLNEGVMIQTFIHQLVHQCSFLFFVVFVN